MGPVVHNLSSLDSLNTSNQRIRDIITGASKKALPPTGNHLFVDVRDLALAHVLAAESSSPDVVNQRFFMVAGKFSNREITDIVREDFTEFASCLPDSEEALTSGDYPDGDPGKAYDFDNAKAKDVLEIQFRGLRESIGDAVESLRPYL